MHDTAIRQLESHEMGELRTALVAANLPIDDLDDPHRMFFRFSDRALDAFAGLEGEGAERLLRSVVVAAAHRRAGLGSALIAAVEAEASRIGVTRLHLLTSGAAPFFRALGYRDADRANAPEIIASTAQFRALCPASAGYLTKEL